MKLDWLDIVKLTFPFATAILMVWIKTWIETYLSKKNKQHAISRVLSDEIQRLPDTILILSNIAESATTGYIHLVSFDTPSILSKFGNELADIDSKHAYCYADFTSCIEIVNKGIFRLSSLLINRAGTVDEDVGSQIDCIICGQSKITANDYISFGKAALKVFNIIPEGRRYVDVQALENLEQAVRKAELYLENWPNFEEKKVKQMLASINS